MSRSYSSPRPSSRTGRSCPGSRRSQTPPSPNWRSSSDTAASDVIVVGAGLSGLVAARELNRNGLTVTVLEARDRPGGRTCVREIDGVVLDLGGEWVDEAHTELRDLAGELGLSVVPVGGSKSDGRWNIRGEMTDHIPLSGADERVYERFAEAMREVSEGRDSEHFHLDAPRERSDDISVRAWLAREGMSDYGLHVVETLLASCGSTVPLSEMSFYAYANKAATRGGPGRGNEYRITSGAGNVAATMAEELSERVRYSSVVVGIEQSDGVEVRCITPEGYETHRARKLILAVPPPVWKSISFSPEPPLVVRKMARRATFGVVRKMHFVFDREIEQVPFTVSDTLLGYCGAAQSSGNSNGIVSFCGGEPLTPELGRSEGDRIERGVRTLRRLYDVPEPVAVVEKVWAGDVFSGGSYMILAPGDLATFGGAMGTSFGDVYLAGAEGYAAAPSFMNSAVISGRNAARRISESLKSN